MQKNYFVMLSHPTVVVIPLMATDDEMAFFVTRAEAIAAGKDNSLGRVYGFEVFEIGCGDYQG